MSGGGPEKEIMTNFIMPNNVSSMNYALKSVPFLALLVLGSPMGMGMAPELHPDVQSRSGKNLK